MYGHLCISKLQLTFLKRPVRPATGKAEENYHRKNKNYLHLHSAKNATLFL